MKLKRIAILLLTVLLCVSLAVCASCKNEDEPPTPLSAVVSIDNKIEQIELGGQHSLIITQKNLSEGMSVQVTSSSPNVVFVENNVVTAKSVGSATITASAGEISDSFVVTVVNQIRPTIGVDAEPGYQFEGATFQLVPYVAYSEKVDEAPKRYYDDIVFSYSSAVQSVAMVSASGLITAVAQGETVINISATYKQQTVTQSYSLTVVNGNVLTLDKSTLNLVTSDESKKQATVIASGYQNNQVIESDELIWSIVEGADIISLSNGNITALKYGSAVIKVAYQSDDSLYAMCSVIVTRGEPQATETSIELDRRNGQSVSSLFTDKIANVDTDEIVTLTDSQGNSLLDGNGTVKGSLLTANPSEVTTLLVGTNTHVYSVSAKVYSLLIANADDLKKADSMLIWEGKLAYGYFKLTNDIDMSGIDWNCDLQIAYLEDNDFAYYDGFAGEFDGNGKTISNLTTSTTQYNGAPHGGLFYELANGSYVHDVNFTNVTISGHKSGVIASAVMGGRIENINVSLLEVHQGYAGVGTSAILGNVLYADYFGAVTVKNVVVDTTAIADIANKNYFAVMGYTHNSVDSTGLQLYKEKITLENVSIIGTTKLFMYGNGTIITDTSTLENHFTIVNDSVKLYATKSDYDNGSSIQEYSVNFDSNGGSAVASTTVLIGGKVTKPTDPTRADDDQYVYAFDGWFIKDSDNDASNDVAWNFDTDFVTQNLNLIAHWSTTEKVVPPDFDNITATINYDADQSTGIDFATAIGSTYGNVKAVYASDKTTQVATTNGISSYTLAEASPIAEVYYVVTDSQDNNVIQVNVTKWSQLIYTVSDMANLGQYEYSPETNVYVSYIKFMADIDMTGVTYVNSTPIGHNAPCYGFFGWQGVMEGNNKTITGFTSQSGGELISRMGKGAIVRNLNFADATVGGGDRALLCNFLGGGTFLNVNISVKTGYDGSFNDKTAVFAKEIPYADGYWNDECIITLENVTVTRSNTNSTDTKQAVLVCLTSGDYPNLSTDQLKSRLILKNVKVSGFSAFICDFRTGVESTAVGVVNGDNIDSYATVTDCNFVYVPSTEE